MHVSYSTYLEHWLYTVEYTTCKLKPVTKHLPIKTGSTDSNHPKTTHKLNTMDAHTAAIAADAACIRKGHALKLRVVQHKYAAQVAAHPRS
jgi:hypothetical protein